MNPKAWSTACPDWEDRILTGQSLVPDLPLFKDEAARALRIFKRLRIPDVIGKPTLAEACGAWFFPIVAAMFGSYDPATHHRMIQEYFLLIAKKNAKSSNGGPLMLTAAIMNRRPEAEFNYIGPTINIANIAFKQTTGTIRQDPELIKAFHIQDHLRTVTRRLDDTKLRILAADTDIVTGGKAVGTMIDETHVFAEKSKAADIFVELRGALAARPDGFLFQTTTQSKKPPAGVFKTELEKARDVRDGKLDLPLLPILYEYPEKLLKGDRWKQRKYWHIPNPNLGRSISEKFLEEQLMLAEREGPEKMVLVASQHFNVEIGLSLMSDRWVGADFWQQAGDDTLSLDEILIRCEVVVVGVDGGGLDDLLGFGVLGRERDTRNWLHWAKAWVHKSVLDLRKSEAPKFRELEAADQLMIVDDLSDARTEIGDIVVRIDEAGLLAEKNAVGVDPMGVGLLVDEIVSREIDADRIIGIPQGWQLNGAIKTAEVKLSENALIHSGQAIMAYSVGNAKIEPKGNAITITKQTAGRAKIDPLMAFFNCIALMSKNPEAAGGRSIYDTLGSADAAAAEAEAIASATTDAEMMEILRDTRHPRFQEMRERYEARMARSGSEDEDWF